jgi:predicted phage baseplate assembly protein
MARAEIAPHPLATEIGGRHFRADRWERILAVYRTTRGVEGALAAGTTFALADTTHTRLVVPDFDQAQESLLAIESKLAASGGTPGETSTDAAARAFAAVRSSERAVTLADYEARAFTTPGVRVARAKALANLHPAFPCYRAPGVVTVIALPFLPAARPEPSAALLRAVARHLAPRRVLGTRVEVVGPSYVEIGVRARVRALRGVDRTALSARLRAALETFLHPLRGGPDGKGWPFGRDVYRSEVLQVLAETPGADHVLALEFLSEDGCAACGNVCLPPLGLVSVGKVEVEVA